MRHYIAKGTQSLPRSIARSPLRFASSSASSSSSDLVSTVEGWQPALPKGQLPAYDLALSYIAADAASSRSRAGELRQRASRATDAVEKKELESLAEEAEVEALLNDPGIRKQVESEEGDMGTRIVRQLIEQRWRLEGRLGRVMETLHRMRVFPDLLPGFAPQVDLRIGNLYKRARTDLPPADFTTKRPQGETETTVGALVSAQKTLTVPTFSAQVFHPEERLYTLLIVDSDVPDPTNQSYTTFLHYLLPNIPLSATSSTVVPSSSSSPLVDWVPPHPAKGSSVHRYSVFLLSQPGLPAKAGSGETPTAASPEREGFSLRRWVEETGMQAVGCTAWTAIWSEADSATISEIYKDLGVLEPEFGRAPPADTGVRRRKPLAPVPLRKSVRDPYKIVYEEYAPEPTPTTKA